jgi:hypothetical protein
VQGEGATRKSAVCAGYADLLRRVVETQFSCSLPLGWATMAAIRSIKAPAGSPTLAGTIGASVVPSAGPPDANQ